MNEQIKKYYEMDGLVENMALWLEQRDFYNQHYHQLTGEEKVYLLIALNSTAVDIGCGHLALEYMDLFDQLKPYVKSLEVKMRLQMLKSAISFYFGSPDVKKLENDQYFELLNDFDDSDPKRFTHYSNWVYERTVYYRDFGWPLEEVHAHLVQALDVPFIETYLAKGFKSYRFVCTNFCRLFLDVGDQKQLKLWANIYRKHVHVHHDRSPVYNLAAIASYEALADERFEDYYGFTRIRFAELKHEGMIDTLRMVYKEVMSDAKRLQLNDFLFEVLMLQIQDIEEGLWEASEEKYAAYLMNEDMKTWNELAYVDSLTGVYNRRYYEECDKTNIAACAVLDIDKMKMINDTYGHTFGDEAIILLASSMKATAIDGVTVIRYGGDEFVILFDYTVEDIIGQTQKMYASIQQMFIVHDQSSITFTTSMGMAIRDQESFEQLFERADEALYVAKNNGRHQLYMAENQLHEQ